MKRLLTILTLLACCLVLYADKTASKPMSDIEKESLARWQKIVDLKNSSQTKKLAEEAPIQMEWFSKQGEWDNYYRTWQLKANALSAMGKLKMALQETQQMLNDAKERDNKLGRAMAYKQHYSSPWSYLPYRSWW